MIVASDLNAPICTISKDDNPYMLEKEGQVQTPCHNINIDPNVDAVRLKPTERHPKQLYRHNIVNISDKISKASWQEKLKLPNENSVNYHNFTKMTTQF